MDLNIFFFFLFYFIRINMLYPYRLRFCSDIRNISFSRRRWRRRLPRKRSKHYVEEALDGLRFCWFCRGYGITAFQLSKANCLASQTEQFPLMPKIYQCVSPFCRWMTLQSHIYRNTAPLWSGYGVIFIYPFPFHDVRRTQNCIRYGCDNSETYHTIYTQFFRLAQMANNIFKFNVGK